MVFLVQKFLIDKISYEKTAISNNEFCFIFSKKLFLSFSWFFKIILKIQN